MSIWTTPSTMPTGFSRWVFYLPSDYEWTAEFFGAMALLFALENFSDGGVTPLEATNVWINSYMGAFVDNQIGQVRYGAWEELPENMLLCDGSTYDRVDYPLLYDAIGTVYHVDTDTFNVPDLRGRVTLGTGMGAGLSNRVLGALGGQETVQLTVGELPAHDHSTHTYSLNVDLEGAGVPDPSAIGLPELPDSTGNTGGNEAHTNMQPFLALMAGIVWK